MVSVLGYNDNIDFYENRTFSRVVYLSGLSTDSLPTNTRRNVMAQPTTNIIQGGPKK